MLFVQLDRALADRERGARGIERVVHGPAAGIAALGLENDHEPIARRLVHVALVLADDLEEGGEVGLHQLVEPLGLHLLGEARVARNVEEENGDLLLPLLQLGGRRVALEQFLDRIGHELGELALELLQHFQALARGLELLEAPPVLRPGRREAAGPARIHMLASVDWRRPNMVRRCWIGCWMSTSLRADRTFASSEEAVRARLAKK